MEVFDEGDWQVIGAHTGTLDIINSHPRLLRSLSFGDTDYKGNAHRVLFQVVEQNYANLKMIESYISDRYRVVGEDVSTVGSKGRAIVFKPGVFETPDGSVEPDLVAVMIPFLPQFEPVFGSIKAACTTNRLRALRAKDIWEHSTVIQDIFSLIFRSKIVVCDFSGKNPNVFYEAGIAHTLGKHVIPITQSAEDVPFDLRHHRYVPYLNNDEGRHNMMMDLEGRLRSLA